MLLADARLVLAALQQLHRNLPQLVSASARVFGNRGRPGRRLAEKCVKAAAQSFLWCHSLYSLCQARILTPQDFAGRGKIGNRAAG